jgi:hypothetical protein
VEQSRLSLDARLGDFFPKEFVRRVHPRGSAITLTHLLNHTAGLWDFALSDEWGRELRCDLGAFRHPDAILEGAVTHGAPVGDVGAGHVCPIPATSFPAHPGACGRVAYKTVQRRINRCWQRRLEGH